MHKTPEELQAELSEKRPLPTTPDEFELWAKRIIGGVCLKRNESVDETRYEDSLKFALSNMLLHLGPTTDFECDAYFIKSLRKAAINQVADQVRNDLKLKATARQKAEEEQKKLEQEASTSQS